MLNVSSASSSDESSSSMGTATPDAAIGADDQHPDTISEGSTMTDNNEAEWRVVTAEGLDTQGVLILDGEELEVNHQISDDGVDVGASGSNLSVPGTDSVPTIVGSLEGFPTHHVSNNREDTTATASNNEEETLVPPSDSYQTQGGTHHATAKSRLVLFLVPTVALFLVPSMASIRLYGAVQRLQDEKDSLRGHVKFLEEEKEYLAGLVSGLEGDKECLAGYVTELEQDKSSLVTEVSQLEKDISYLSGHASLLEEEVVRLKIEQERKKQEDTLNWNDSSSCGGREDLVILDNCWLSAKANVQLGNCANDAKEVVKDFSLSLLERLEKLGNSSSWVDPFSHHHHEDARDGGQSAKAAYTTTLDTMDESMAKMMRKVDSLGKALWNATIMHSGEEKSSYGAGYAKGKNETTGEDFTFGSSFFAKMEANGKSWWKESIFNMFLSPEDEAQKARVKDVNQAAREMYSEAVVAADAALSMISAGEALVAAAVEKAAQATMEFNQTSLSDLLDIAKQAFEDASLTHAAATGK